MTIYLFLYVATAASLGLWFLYRTQEDKERGLQRLFFLFFFAYLGVVALAEARFGTKLWVLFRDLSVLALLGGLFQAATHKRSWFIGASVAAGALLLWFVPNQMSGSLSPADAPQHSYDPDGELLIELAEGSSVEALATPAYKYSLTFAPAFQVGDPAATELDDYYTINIPESHLSDLEAILRDLQAVPEVDWVEPNERISLHPLPAPPAGKVARRFGVNDPDVGRLWGFEAMKVHQLYPLLNAQRNPPAKTALIVILDTGVDAKHEDLSGNYHSLNASDDNDPRGHGTHCAGIAAAVSNNGVGIASFSVGEKSYVKVSSIKVLNAAGMGTQKSIINGMVKAADAGADVISMSLGGLSSQSRERAYRKAVEYAQGKGAIVVAAAGNANRNAKNYVPAAVPGVISVSAIDSTLNRAAFSNYVTDLKMGLAAPGVGIYSTIPGDRYDTYNGTSMATPYVSGLIGLLKSLRPSLTAAEAYQILRETGIRTRQPQETGPLIQPAEAVARLLPASES